MRAAVLETVGASLALREVAEPTPGTEESVVTVHAAAINYADTLIRRGLYPQPPPLPWIPGVEVSGTTEDGRKVIGLIRAGGGGFADQAAVEDDWLFDLPVDASAAEGASFLTAFLTAWLPLTRQANVRPGSRVLVHAAAGGVGSAAIQVARVLGAEVVATAGSEAKCERALELGATQAVTYDRLPELEPVDVVLDPVGGSLLADSLRLLRPFGVALAIGFAGGPWSPLDPALLVGRNIGVQGFYLGRLMQLRPNLVQTAAADLVRLWEAELLRPVVGSTFPLTEANEAMQLLEERHSTGKVVLLP